MADLGELDVLIIGGGMGGCIVATDQSAPEFGREHKEFMRDVYILQRPHRVRAEYLKRGSIGISLVRPSGVLGKMDAYLDLEYDRTDPGTLRRLREGHEIGLEILKKMGAREISESEDGVRITNVSGISSSCRATSRICDSNTYGAH